MTAGTGLPAGPNRTIVRNNVWIKNDQPDAVSESSLSLVGNDFSSLGFHVYLGGK